MANSIYFERALPRSWMLAGILILQPAMAKEPTMQASPSQAQTISLGKGHFVVEFDPSVESYQLTSVVIPGQCTPRLSLQEEGDGLAVKRESDDCKADTYAKLRLNPTWASDLHLSLSAGQLDLQPTLLSQVGKLVAAVKVGDIIGHRDVKRSWLLGANLSLENGTGTAVRATVGAGQITLVSASVSP